MQSQYGADKGKQVFYASMNSGRLNRAKMHNYSSAPQRVGTIKGEQLKHARKKKPKGLIAREREKRRG